MKIFLTFLLAFLFGCGTATDSTNNNTKDKGTETTDKTTATALDGNDYFTVDGYVSPINISVNGQNYRDSEDFYTQEVKKLTAETAVKYPGYTIHFDADVGLRDFKYGLSVFLVASNTTGIASESSVDGRGKFTFNLPKDVDKDAPYILRASKRIGLRLIKDNVQPITWCYNLFAESEVALSNKPFILRTFETTITSYKCEEKESAIALPDNPYNYVVEAFENADEYHGYGPLPKKKTTETGTTTTTGTGTTTTGTATTGTTTTGTTTTTNGTNTTGTVTGTTDTTGTSNTNNTTSNKGGIP